MRAFVLQMSSEPAPLLMVSDVRECATNGIQGLRRHLLTRLHAPCVRTCVLLVHLSCVYRIVACTPIRVVYICAWNTLLLLPTLVYARTHLLADDLRAHVCSSFVACTQTTPYVYACCTIYSLSHAVQV